MYNGDNVYSVYPPYPLSNNNSPIEIESLGETKPIKHLESSNETNWLGRVIKAVRSPEGIKDINSCFIGTLIIVCIFTPVVILAVGCGLSNNENTEKKALGERMMFGGGVTVAVLIILALINACFIKTLLCCCEGSISLKHTFSRREQSANNPYVEL